MPNFDVAGPELKKMLKKAAQDDVAFAFNPGKSEVDTYFGMHNLKSPAALLKEAKAVGSGPKSAFGYSRVALTEKEFRLTCEMTVPNLAKKLKKFLKVNKVNLNVVVMDADGNVLESDIEDLPNDAEGEDDDGAPADGAEARAEAPDAPSPAPEDAKAEPALDASQLLQRLMAVRDKLKELPEAAAASLIDPFKKTVAMVKANALDAAAANIEKLEKAVAQRLSASAAPPPPPPNPMQQKLMQLAEMLRTQAGALPDADRRTKIEQAINRAVDAISKDEFREAAALLGKIRDILKPQDSASAPADQQGEKTSAAEGGKGSETRWKDAYDGWLDANDRLDKQLNNLRSAILQETGYPEFSDELADIARVGLNALTGNNRVKMMAALQMIGPGDAESIRTHGEKASSAVANFKAFLDSNIQVDACEGNPWDVDVQIRGTLYPPLNQLSALLQGQA